MLKALLDVDSVIDIDLPDHEVSIASFLTVVQCNPQQYLLGVVAYLCFAMLDCA